MMMLVFMTTRKLDLRSFLLHLSEQEAGLSAINNLSSSNRPNVKRLKVAHVGTTITRALTIADASRNIKWLACLAVRNLASSSQVRLIFY
jgi:hypothetical protein